MEEQNIKKHVNVTIIDVTQRGTDTWSDSYKIFREFTGTEYQEATYIFTKIENGNPYVIERCRYKKIAFQAYSGLSAHPLNCIRNGVIGSE